MSTVNNYLFSLQHQAPALLQVGGDKLRNFQNLEALNSLWSDNQSPWASLGSTAGPMDVVTLAYQKIGDRMLTELAALTAEAIKEDPSLDHDYLIALLDSASGLEARVYRRSEILAGFEGAAEEKMALADLWEANPLLVFSEAAGLPAGADDASAQKLAAALNGFLKTNAKTLKTLNNAGYNPFLEFTAPDALKKILGLQPAAEV